MGGGKETAQYTDKYTGRLSLSEESRYGVKEIDRWLERERERYSTVQCIRERDDRRV